MTTVLDIEHRLDGEIIVRDEHVGDIRCIKLTITRTGSVKGNILCKHLQIGGYVEGIAVCHALEGNTQGILHGSLYYVTKKDEAKVAGIVDYREPPFSVWAVVMPDAVSPLDAVVAEAVAEALDERPDVIPAEISADISLSADSAGVTDDMIARPVVTSDEIGVITPPSAQPKEISGTSSKFLQTPLGASPGVETFADPVPAAWVSTGRKVPLGARFF